MPGWMRSRSPRPRPCCHLAFRNRLLIPHPQLLAHTTCSCSKEVDPYGIHIQKCRLDGNLTNATYNNLGACLAEMNRHCGQSVRVEVSGIFNNVDPSSNQRMDLVVYDPGQPNALYDVVVTNPLRKSWLPIASTPVLPSAPIS